ncbi:MAG: haloacid dehalogenase-like hydrolase [Anaerolineae bacterium]|nr:haloacid dehalogenase-like hydrolase [Anaerolineae bacterium]
MADNRVLALFDIDGTLLHSGGCGRAATQLALADVFGTTGALDEVNFAGKTDWQILREVLEPVGFSADMIEARLAQHNETVARRMIEIIDDFPVRPCVGAPEVVAALKADPRVVLGLVTGNTAALVPIKLRAAGFDPADFKIGAFGSEGWTRAMLPPLALERARAYTNGDFAPARIVIIGDTPGDITCAASVQGRTIAVATGPFRVDELRQYQPDHVFETMQDHARVIAAVLHNGRATA